ARPHRRQPYRSARQRHAHRPPRGGRGRRGGRHAAHRDHLFRGPSGPHAAADPNTLVLVLRLGLSFGMVLGLVAGVTWVLRRRGLLRPNAGHTAGGRLEGLDRKSLGKSSSLVLARVGDTAVLLGVTGERIEVLSDRPGLDA